MTHGEWLPLDSPHVGGRGRFRVRQRHRPTRGRPHGRASEFWVQDTRGDTHRRRNRWVAGPFPSHAQAAAAARSLEAEPPMGPESPRRNVHIDIEVRLPGAVHLDFAAAEQRVLAGVAEGVMGPSRPNEAVMSTRTGTGRSAAEIPPSVLESMRRSMEGMRRGIANNLMNPTMVTRVQEQFHATGPVFEHLEVGSLMWVDGREFRITEVSGDSIVAVPTGNEQREGIMEGWIVSEERRGAKWSVACKDGKGWYVAHHGEAYAGPFDTMDVANKVMLFMESVLEGTNMDSVLPRSGRTLDVSLDDDRAMATRVKDLERALTTLVGRGEEVHMGQLMIKMHYTPRAMDAARAILLGARADEVYRKAEGDTDRGDEDGPRRAIEVLD